MSIKNAAALVLLALGAAGGCARTIVSTPLATDYDPLDAEQELGFLHALPTRSAVTNDEGLHGFLLLIDGEDQCGNFDQRCQMLKERGWLDAAFAEPANMTMRRGTLATCLAEAFEIEGGVMMRVLGPTARYSTRELVDMGIMPAGSERQSMTGGEFLAILSKAQDYRLIRDAKGAEEGGQ